MTDPYIGEIRAFGFNFAPQGWATCNGQLLSISQNAALFSLLGTTYGGNGQTTFGLPDLRGRAGVGQGQGPGLFNNYMGQTYGREQNTLTVANLPAHTHGASGRQRVANARAASNRPEGGVPAIGGSYAAAADATGDGAPVSVTVNAAGSGQPFDNTVPSLVLNYCIAVQGIYPSRP